MEDKRADGRTRTVHFPLELCSLYGWLGCEFLNLTMTQNELDSHGDDRACVARVVKRELCVGNVMTKNRGRDEGGDGQESYKTLMRQSTENPVYREDEACTAA